MHVPICWQSPFLPLDWTENMTFRIHLRQRLLPPMARGPRALPQPPEIRILSVTLAVASLRTIFKDQRFFNSSKNYFVIHAKMSTASLVLFKAWGPRDDNYDKEVWEKVTFLKSQVLWPLHLLEKSLQEEGGLIERLNGKEWQIKTPLRNTIFMYQNARELRCGKGALGYLWHQSVNWYSLSWASL